MQHVIAISYNFYFTFQGWAIFRDTLPMIELARTLATRLSWDARIVDVESNIDERVLVCRKSFPGDKV